MIGQTQNLEIIEKWINNKSIPRFIIIEGEEGSGKLTLAKYIANKLNSECAIVGNSINDIREVINSSYMINNTTCYIIRDGQELSASAKNSLLKIVEEPPNKVYFIMTLNSLSNMLETIKSRATILKMFPYTKEELHQCTKSDLLVQYCDTIGQIKSIEEKDLKLLLEKIDNTIEQLLNKSGVRTLVAVNCIKTKETEDDKFDATLFLNIFIKRLYEKNIVLPIRCYSYISQCKEQLNRKGVNKKASIETMFIKILRILKNDSM